VRFRPLKLKFKNFCGHFAMKNMIDAEAALTYGDCAFSTGKNGSLKLQEDLSAPVNSTTNFPLGRQLILSIPFGIRY